MIVRFIGRAGSARGRALANRPSTRCRLACDDRSVSISILDRELFSEAEAARLLRVAQSTLHYWLEGGTKRGKTYPPVVRAEPRDERTVTWAEFVEAGLLREYRRELRVPMMELRAFIDRLPDVTANRRSARRRIRPKAAAMEMS